MKRFILSALIGLTGMVLPLSAHDFSVRINGDHTLYFNILDQAGHTVEVASASSSVKLVSKAPAHKLEIPGTVHHKNVEWRVVAIGAKAFAGAEELTHIVLPSSVEKIGEAAFSGCSVLTGVLLPAHQVSVAKDAFADCPCLADITFGSDWTEIDLGLFKDSKALKRIQIPVHTRKLTNLKALDSLERVEVDANNSSFCSVDGILYSKDKKSLYACPRGRSGEVIVPEGTVSVLEGAFADCAGLYNISLPASLEKVSYLEFARCTNLKTLKLYSATPVLTARREGEPVFAFRAPSPKLKVFVPGVAFREYVKAVCAKAGHYESMDGKHKEYFQRKGFVTEWGIREIR